MGYGRNQTIDEVRSASLPRRDAADHEDFVTGGDEMARAQGGFRLVDQLFEAGRNAGHEQGFDSPMQIQRVVDVRIRGERKQRGS